MPIGKPFWQGWKMERRIMYLCTTQGNEFPECMYDYYMARNETIMVYYIESLAPRMSVVGVLSGSEGRGSSTHAQAVLNIMPIP